jgi:conjugative transposon TraN protein
MKRFLTVFLLPLSLSAQLIPSPSNPATYGVAEQSNEYLLPIDKISIKGSYPLGVSQIKTVHVVFPAEIKEVDAGTADILVQITPSFNNVLKVKSLVAGEITETNLTVLTADGGYYSFIINYQENPEILNVNIGNNLRADAIISDQSKISYFNGTNYVDRDINKSYVTIENNLQKAVEQRKFIKNVGVENLKVSSFLRAINAEDDILYLTFDIINDTEIDYEIDFIKLYVKDRELVKKMTVQEEELPVLRTYPRVTKVLANEETRYSIATLLRTIADDKVMELEIYDKAGGRHLRFQIDPKIIARSKNFKR